MPLFRALATFLFFFVCSNALALSGPDVKTGQMRNVEPGAKGLVVVFLSAKCPCSNSHVPELAELAKEFTEFHFVGVHSNMDESEDVAKDYFTKVNLPFPVLQDSQAQIADEYRALKTPHAYIRDSAERLVFQGGMSDSKDCADSDRKFLREALTDLRAGRPVRAAKVRTLGCTISRRKHG